MTEERRDNSIFVLGILIAAALALYGLYTEENPTVVEIVELVSNHIVKYLEPKIITRVDKQVVYLTATPGPSINEFIYSTPIAFSDPAITTDPVLTESEIEATLRALTPIVPTPSPSPTNTMVPPPPPSTMPPMPTEAPAAPTEAPAPPTEVPAAPTEAPPPPTQEPPLPTVAPPPPTVPPTIPPTVAPPTQIPPTQIPPTQIPPTQIPPTQIPPTQIPPTVAPPTIPPTQIPPTEVPPTMAPPTEVPQVMKQLTPVPVAPLQVEEKSNPELPPISDGMATLQGNLDSGDESGMTMILTNGEYYNTFDVGSDGEFWFENVPNGTYNLSVNNCGPGAGCAEITVSVPEGHRDLTYNYRFYKMQCSSTP